MQFTIRPKLQEPNDIAKANGLGLLMYHVAVEVGHTSVTLNVLRSRDEAIAFAREYYASMTLSFVEEDRLEWTE